MNLGNLGHFTSIIADVKQMNGRFKPKFGKAAIPGIIFLILLFIAFIIGEIYGILHLDFECIFWFALGIVAGIYIFLISPYTQNPKNYHIEFESDNSLNNLKVSYKNKLVVIQYRIDSTGRIAFLNDSKKTDCISYADGSKMSKLTKFRIANYFAKWLHDYDLLSSEVRGSFE